MIIQVNDKLQSGDIGIVLNGKETRSGWSVVRTHNQLFYMHYNIYSSEENLFTCKLQVYMCYIIMASEFCFSIIDDIDNSGKISNCKQKKKDTMY